jgi:hypothetical protein
VVLPVCASHAVTYRHIWSAIIVAKREYDKWMTSLIRPKLQQSGWRMKLQQQATVEIEP